MSYLTVTLTEPEKEVTLRLLKAHHSVLNGWLDRKSNFNHPDYPRRMDEAGHTLTAIDSFENAEES